MGAGHCRLRPDAPALSGLTALTALPTGVGGAAVVPLTIPSPERSGVHLGPLTVHFYALCILAGIVAGIWLGRRRFIARGGTPESLESILAWAIPSGIIGARLYHVITDHQLYFGPGRNPWDALKIWQGGLGIWGAIALGALGAWLACRHRGVRFWALADALAPGIIVAQAIGRLGNWFNSELFGRPTTLPWALEIAPRYRPQGYEQFATFHPTFLYELVWNLLVAGVLLALDRRYRLGRGKLFWLYVALYTLGRAFIERLRIDTVVHVGGWRLNEYTSVMVCAIAWIVFAWLCWRKPGPDVDAEPGRGTGSETSEHAAA